MSLSIRTELIRGSYDAGDSEKRSQTEWPPHPARLFCALVAAASTEEHRDALRWLEMQPAPLIAASSKAFTLRRESYVVTNQTESRGGHLSHPGRTSRPRQRMATIPSEPRVIMIWPDADPDAAIATTLDGLSRRVPYLGRSSGVAIVSARTQIGITTDELLSQPDLSSLAVYEPCDLVDAELSARVPYGGYLEALTDQYHSGQPAWGASRFAGYRSRDVATRPGNGSDAVVPSVYKDLVVLRFAGLKPDGRLAVRFTEALRSAVLRQTQGTAPAVLHGHGADGRPHVAFLALPDAGYEHSTGYLHGLAVATPEVSDDERRTVVRAVLALRGNDDRATLDVPGIGRVELEYQPGVVRPWAANPDRWRRGGRRWASVTPVVLDRYPKKGDVEAEIRRSCGIVGLPDPITVDHSRVPMIRGAVHLQPHDLPAHTKGRVYQHVSLTFDQRVSGPVLLGAGRYLGVGLLAPISEGAEQ